MTVYTLAIDMVRDLPPATAPELLWGAVDADEEPRAVITLQVAMTRDMLATALDLTAGNDRSNPDTWTVRRIRQDIEMALSIESVNELQRDAEEFPELLDDPSVRDRIQATYRAIDRAYPLYAPKES